MHDSTSLTYRDAGVDIDAGNQLVDAIKPLAKATKRSGCDAGLGGFGALFDLKATQYRDPILVSTTDGVGTKLHLAIAQNKHDTIGIDLVAMCVNDLIVQGAEPLFFLDYFATARLNVANATHVIAGISQGCQQAGCALVGGETAEMPGMYHGNDYDLAGFSVGAVERDQLLPRHVNSGDLLLGIASSGIHANGFSLVRKILEHRGLSYQQPAPFSANHTLGDILLTPTKIYVQPLLTLLRQGAAIHAMAHITGGGLTENLPRVLPAHLSAHIDPTSWTLPALFAFLQSAGNIEEAEMRRTFNCGIGMVLIVSKDEANPIINELNNMGEQAFIIGDIRARKDEDSPALTYGPL
jgi:phosphoribosylformylglycinamidine cyclo-ligase